MKRAIILLGAALSILSGQSTGPSVLSRGQAPSAMGYSGNTFQPYFQATARYETSLTGVGLTDEGAIPNVDSSAISLDWGVSGSHQWRRTQLGIAYNGGFTRYTRASSFDALTQFLSLSVTRDLARHLVFNYRQTGGFFSRLTGIEGLRQTVPFDPATTYIPTTEFYDDRTYHASGQAGLTYQKSARLSFNLGGGLFMIGHRSKALHGTRGVSAYADVQYRVSRRATIGVLYQFSNFRYTGLFGDSYIHAGGLSFAYQFSHNLEFSGFGGIMRPESLFVQTVPVDPAIAQLIGITTARQVVHSISNRAFWSARMSRTFRSGVAYASAGQTAAPGNGLFLTSYTTTIMGGYGYTGLRRWSMNANVRLTDAKSVSNVAGPYRTVIGGASISRKIAGSLHVIARYSIRQYDSSAFENYNRLTHSGTIGFGFSPGDVPLRLW